MKPVSTVRATLRRSIPDPPLIFGTTRLFLSICQKIVARLELVDRKYKWQQRTKWAIRHGLTYSVVSWNSSGVGTWDGPRRLLAFTRSPKLLRQTSQAQSDRQVQGPWRPPRVEGRLFFPLGFRPTPTSSSLGKLRKAAPTSSGRCVQTSSRVVSERQGACPASTNLVHCQYSVVLRPNCEETVKILPMTGSSVSDELTYSGTWAQGSCLF